MNRVVARFNDGRVAKGMTADFSPAKPSFHISDAIAPTEAPAEIRISDLKALFFVKDLEGDSRYAENKEFDPLRPPAGRRIQVVFKDGEVMRGTTQGYQSGRQGFFLEPVDGYSNNERAYVVSASTESITFI